MSIITDLKNNKEGGLSAAFGFQLHVVVLVIEKMFYQSKTLIIKVPTTMPMKPSGYNLYSS